MAKSKKAVIKQNYTQVVNHLEFHQLLSSKDKLFESLCIYCDKNKLDVFDYTPLSFEIYLDEMLFESLKHYLDYFMKIQSEIHHKELSLQDDEIEELFRNLFALKQQAQSVASLQEKKEFLNLQNKLIKGMKKLSRNFNYGKNAWILKPTDYNRGRGIQFFDNLDALSTILFEYALHGHNSIKKQQKLMRQQNLELENWQTGAAFYKAKPNQQQAQQLQQQSLKGLPKIIIQKYIEKPLLYNQHKFDIRV
eukprot:TRINITY_DN48399_c0_g1_i1.p3 TRINITY_DN48399_c0_g1~~TRINITY_DN48399_c0_g1_i1.p3  ORF type:complete len:250 (+),score=34.58 TRINITY_DN48399_c0_g1_i1:204-953(+)